MSSAIKYMGSTITTDIRDEYKTTEDIVPSRTIGFAYINGFSCVLKNGFEKYSVKLALVVAERYKEEDREAKLRFENCELAVSSELEQLAKAIISSGKNVFYSFLVKVEIFNMHIYLDNPTQSNECRIGGTLRSLTIL